MSGTLQLLPNASEGIRRCPNASEQVRTSPNKSENFPKLQKTYENFQKIAKMSRKIPNGEAYMKTPLISGRMVWELWQVPIDAKLECKGCQEKSHR